MVKPVKLHENRRERKAAENSRYVRAHWILVQSMLRYARHEIAVLAARRGF